MSVLKVSGHTNPTSLAGAISGIDLICIPGFKDIFINGQERTAVKLVVEPR